MNIVADSIVDIKSENEGAFLHKLSSLYTLACALSPECQFLIFTNEDIAHVENTKNVQIYSFRLRGNLLHKFQIKRRLKQKITNWKTDVIIHSGRIPVFRHIHHVLLITNQAELSGLSKKIIKKSSLFFTTSTFIQQELIHNHHISPEKIMVTPFAITPHYKRISPELKETIKSKYSSNAEFFLYNHLPSSKPDFIQLLKGYSLFKKRLQTNMKLLLPCSFPVNHKEIAPLLNTYKFKEDIVFTGSITVDQKAELSAAAYAVIQSAQTQSISQIQDILQCGVPVMVLQPHEWTKDEDCFEYANALSSEEIAGKMMLLYKDEAHRNKLIRNSQQLLLQFSVEATAKTFHTALLRAVAE